ncbi:MAG: PAS domain S-box protein [Reichenbachiella sp.]|uniref:PAS domain S-box protein n=1 Tax=Reichenbachiella sp. TaxID=2184521 RepID=UPI0032652980
MKRLNKKEPIPKFLILEDEPNDLKLTLRALAKDKMKFEHRAVDKGAAFKKELKVFKPDLIIADYNLPTYTGMDALKWVNQNSPETPFIFVTGSLGEERAVETVKQGASDFVLKGNLVRLPMVIRRALKEIAYRKEKIQAQNAFRTAEARYKQLIENAPVGICELDLNGQITSVNKQASQIFEMKQNNKLLSELLDQNDSGQLNEWLKHKVNGKAFKGNFHSRNGKKLIDLTLIPHYDIETGSKRLIGVSQDITSRSKMENELREKNALLEGLLEAIPDAVFLKDQKFRYLMVNKSFEKILGVEMKDVLKKKDEEFIEKSLAAQYKKTDQEVVRTKELVTTLESHKDENDETFIFDTHKNPILNAKKQVIGIVGVSRNVTASIEAQEKLEQSKSLLLEAEKVANIGSWEFHVSLGKIFCSSGASLLLSVQLSERQVEYKTFLKACHQDDRAKVMTAFKNAILDGEPFSIEHRILRSDGSVSWLHTRGKPNQNERGNIEKIMGTIQDISEQKRSQEKLEKSQELLKEAQSIANIGSFDWNITQNILQCSEEFYSILELGQEYFWLTFDNYLEKIHPADRELTRKKIFDALLAIESYDVEHRVLLPDQSIKTVRAIGRFKADKQNQPERLLGTIQDVSDKKNAQNALLEGQEIERARIAREVHDGIGQLLAATKFNLAALDGMPEKEQEKHIEKIHNTLEMTIDEARRITRNLSTKVLEELGLEKALHELCIEASQLADISFELKYRPGNAYLSDKAQTTIYRMVQESINNIVKYSKAKVAKVQLIQEKNYLHLTISDDGRGFDQSDPKYRKGNGLSNLNQRTKSLHGYLDIDSKPGKGTTIQIKVPFENKNKS